MKPFKPIGDMDKMAEIGAVISSMGFSYRVKDVTDKKYWERRIAEHEEYFEKTKEYHDMSHHAISHIGAEQADRFARMRREFGEMEARQLEILEKIRQNPTVMDSKDRQRSEWSKRLRQGLIDNSNRCLQHEKAMSRFFLALVSKTPAEQGTPGRHRGF